MASTFSLTCLAWIFFRAKDIPHALDYIGGLFSITILDVPTVRPYFLFARILFLLLVEWTSRHREHGLAVFALNWWRPARILLWYVLVLLIAWNAKEQQEFIYFQF